MKKFSALLLLVSLFLTSCQSANLLRATFENDTIGNPPAINLPGDPAGDSIRYHPGTVKQLVVRPSITTGQKALHFQFGPISGEISEPNRGVIFRGINHDLNNTVWFRHSGSIAEATGDVRIDVTDGHGNLIARMLIKSDGEVGLAQNVLDTRYGKKLGRLNKGGHSIIFTVMASQLKYNVLILQSSGESIPPALDQPTLTTDFKFFKKPANPSINFFHSGSHTTTHRYILEEVVISKEEPD